MCVQSDSGPLSTELVLAVFWDVRFPELGALADVLGRVPLPGDLAGRRHGEHAIVAHVHDRRLAVLEAVGVVDLVVGWEGVVPRVLPDDVLGLEVDLDHAIADTPERPRRALLGCPAVRFGALDAGCVGALAHPDQDRPVRGEFGVEDERVRRPVPPDGLAVRVDQSDVAVVVPEAL